MSEEVWAMLSIYGPILFTAVLFYFFLYRPQKAEQQRRADMLATLHRGNKVVTMGGVYGEIVAIEKGVIDLKIADKVVIKVEKRSISRNLTQGKSAAGEPAELPEAQDEPKDDKD